MNRLASEAAYFGAVQDGVESQQELIESLRQQLVLKGHQYDVIKASAEFLAAKCDEYHQKLADSQKREVMLRDALRFYKSALTADDVAGVALAATEPKPKEQGK